MTSEQPCAIILGGTSGLGRQIAIECISRDITPIIMGRSVNRVSTDPKLSGALTFGIDLSNPQSFSLLLPRLVSLMTNRSITHVFWVAGCAQVAPFLELKAVELTRLIDVHITGPLRVLKSIFDELMRGGQPTHLVVISSTSAYKVRSGEEVYCALKAAKSVFARQMAVSLRDKLPGSVVTLVMPGGMETSFWDAVHHPSNVRFMDPAAVAQIISRLTMDPDLRIDMDRNFRSLSLERAVDGTPIPSWRHLNPNNLF